MLEKVDLWDNKIGEQGLHAWLGLYSLSKAIHKKFLGRAPHLFKILSQAFDAQINRSCLEDC